MAASNEGDFTPIEDYGVIGNARTAALVSREGSVDWLCLPRFDSPSVFGRLLDRGKGGRFQVRPAGDVRVRRRYVGATVVLETTFATDGGELVLTDCMPVCSEERKRRRPWPHHQVLRRLECTRGEVDVEVLFDPRPGYGRLEPKIEEHGALGLWCQNHREALALLSDLPFSVGDGGARARCTLRQGDVRHVSLTYTEGEPAVILPIGPYADELIQETLEWWEEWAGELRYDGPYREEVLRSALTLKLLTYAPSGAVVAAATTSLPEVVGGVRNWDYRFCWLRDASWTLRALYELGYREEANAFYDWINYATRLTAPELQTMYDLHGHSRLTERELTHLEGWRSSRPVRVGNEAHGQLQLDVYGEFLAATYEYGKRGGKIDRADCTLLEGIGDVVCTLWREKDEGIWEVRVGARHHTYSKVMCWVALDRIVRMHEEGLLGRDVPADRYRKEMEEIRRTVETEGVHPEVDCYTGVFGEAKADGALLRLPGTGYVKATDPRFRRTFEHLVELLGAGNGLLYRYGPDFDDLPGREGTFDLVSFWAVECRALAGEVDEARRHFEEMLGHANDLGLYSEETDPESLGFLGNFPQAFTHIGLINAALTIEAFREGGDTEEWSPWEHDAAPQGAAARGGAPERT